MSRNGINTLAALILIGLMSGCAARKTSSVAQQAQAPTEITRKWSTTSTPFQATNIISVGNIFWVCGADEMIASSADGGHTWSLRHQSRGGAVLLNIAFVSDKIGHAAGTGGRLLSTADGGKTWRTHNAGDRVWAFSFADANNGIAVIGGDRNAPSGLWGEPTIMGGSVKLIHDGGDHWEDIPVLNTEELRPFTRVLAVAALDASHYLMIRRQPEIEDIFLVTNDGGKSWKVVHQRNDATNRELAGWVFVHGGEYWAFGMELVHRETGGGYGVPLTLHSNDGETWAHGVNGGLHEFGGCNSQGCYMWDGTVETLYGKQEQYWALPQDGSLSLKWAIAGAYACSVSTKETECGPALVTEQPQPHPEAHGPQYMEMPSRGENVAFAVGCLACGVRTIKLNPGLTWHGRIAATLTTDGGGSVKNVSLDGVPNDKLREAITDQVKGWLFEPMHGGAVTTTLPRNISIDVRCLDAPSTPGIDGCRLFPAK